MWHSSIISWHETCAQAARAACLQTDSWDIIRTAKPKGTPVRWDIVGITQTIPDWN